MHYPDRNLDLQRPFFTLVSRELQRLESLIASRLVHFDRSWGCGPLWQKGNPAQRDLSFQRGSGTTVPPLLYQSVVAVPESSCHEVLISTALAFLSYEFIVHREFASPLYAFDNFQKEVWVKLFCKPLQVPFIQRVFKRRYELPWKIQLYLIYGASMLKHIVPYNISRDVIRYTFIWFFILIVWLKRAGMNVYLGIEQTSYLMNST